MDSQKIREQLLYLKGVTVRIGAIHEAQALQLRRWPLLIPSVKSSEANVDIETKTVVYNCKTKKGDVFTKEQLQTSLVAICKWTQTLLWNETRVLVYFGKKKVIDSNDID